MSKYVKKLTTLMLNNGSLDKTLLSNIENHILDENNPVEEKEELISTLIDLLRYSTNEDNNIDNLSIPIRNLYYSYLDLQRLQVLYEYIINDETVVPSDYEYIVLEYFNFLDNIENELYIQNSPKKIKIFNELLTVYLLKKDEYGNTYEELINNPELINTLKSRIDSLDNRKI